ncbi:C40 family peptidase [Cellulomonas humilata]|uniref:C40 family peptidase n=1 Tax=Cellulomonas humilata TaxID=144055 RepID=A0A7Y5ZXG5_9CELL|nr:C40 family peptidase [Cellulomonas humilata]NUU15882.1 C40 family peptidase [Cellulomonas humilata]
MTAGIAAVQTRIGELRQLVEKPAITAKASTPTTGVSFEAALTAAGAPRTSPPSPGSPTGQDLVAAASTYLGVPYVWGGESLDEGGLDCSGLVQRALADLGVTDVPRVARQQMTLGTAVPSLDQALPGDLVVFGGGSHIGIYVGDGKMIDAPKPGKAVVVRDVYTEPTAIRRILPQAGAAAAAATDVGATVAAAQRAALEALVGLNATAGAAA